MVEVTPKVAILATGDELINGQVLNTNAQYIAQQLTDHSIQTGTHLTVGDNQIEMEQAIHFLLQDHVVLITIGGLGPTSDDRTRFALNTAINSKLVFDESCWQRIIERLKRLDLPIPETNKQQCLFPEEAHIIPNDNGTAAACHIQYNQRDIFMLPGPPREFQPIFDEVVLPQLLAMDLQQKEFSCSWLLLRASEGTIAALVDPLITQAAVIAYRVCYPYLEVKLRCRADKIFNELKQQITSILSSYLVSTERLEASMQLYHTIQMSQQPIYVSDAVTGGLLQSKLLTPTTYQKVYFSQQSSNYQKAINISLSGLDNYWQGKQESNIVHIQISQDQQTIQEVTETISYRGDKTCLLATEVICWEILKILKSYQS